VPPATGIAKLVINLKTAKAMFAGAPHKRGKIVLEGNG
jgi:hypothetical protein